ncbi:MAG: cyanophycin synthetase [Myxococcota bacterium]|nr:cyanophycin synthetase [Myxococcota bacterium]
MKVIEKRSYMGPNLYANFPVIRFQIDIGSLEEHPSAEIEGFVDALVAAVPSLYEHGCSYRADGGFIRRLREDRGTWMGHVFEHVAIELQNLVGSEVSFGKTRSVGPTGIYNVIYEYEDEWVGTYAGQLSLRLLHSILPENLCDGAEREADFDFKNELETFIKRTERRALGPSTASLVRAADKRGIPWIRLNEYSLVQFGHGKYQKRIQATVTSETRHIAVELASDKEMTNKILGDIGLPVPKQRDVYREIAAVHAANRIGYPVVVKPYNANHGRGVSIGLTTDEEVRVAFAQARKHSRCVLVESYVRGFDHRMLVINGELVAVSKRVPGHVVGDGVHTIKELVDIVNQDPRRGIGHEKVLTRLELDHQAERLLQAAGYDIHTVLSEGEDFYLRSTANLSTGGTAIDVTDVCHPDNREMAIRAAAIIGLDVAGVDFLSTDISRSYKDIGGGICEVNAAPGFRMHISPSQGESRDVASKVIDMLFPHDTPTRIPIAAITGTNGKTTTTRMLAHIHKMAGENVGMTTTDGVYIDGSRTIEGDMTGPVSARMVLKDPSVSVAVLETARGGMLRAGLGYSAPDVACCLNVAADHLGTRGIDTLEQLAEVKRIPIEVARKSAVLNADDSLCLRMAAYTKAKQIVYVTMNSRNQLVRKHIRAGGQAVVLEEGINGHMISIYDNGTHVPLLWTHLIPATLEGQAMHNVQNAMFAAAMANSMGVSLDNIRQGLRTFDTSFFQVPGRMNIFDKLGFKVILDYGHNPAAVQAMCTLVDRLSQSGALGSSGKRVCVLAAPGDRRDEDIINIAHLAVDSFDYFICRQDDSRRGRADGEVPLILKKALMEKGVLAEQIQLCHSEVDAVEEALNICEQGDLLLIFADKITRSWKQIIYFHDAQVQQKEDASPSVVEEDFVPVLEDVNLEQDERGVFLPIEQND